MPMQEAVLAVFLQLKDSIKLLSPSQYNQPCRSLSDHTIGQHVRHIVELFQCLEKGYELGTVNYDRRKRDTQIETDGELACKLLDQIGSRLNRPDKELRLAACFGDQTDQITLLTTNYFREIAYNLEHAIHHMALMRIGISELSDLELSDEYGVASSTLKYRRKCAQ